jgi:hypothetical protein
MDGVIVAYVALADSENAEILEIEDEVELTFGGIRIVPFPDAPSATPSAPGIQRHPALPTFFVHIGLPNTATTTIQGFFGANRTALLEQGILYPESGAIHDSHSLVHRPLGAVLDPDSEPWLAPMASRFRERDVLSRLRGEVTATNALKIVLSSEDLTFMRGPALLKQALEPYQVRILVTIRRQDSFRLLLQSSRQKPPVYEDLRRFSRQQASEPSKPEAYCPDLAISLSCSAEQLGNGIGRRIFSSAFTRISHAVRHSRGHGRRSASRSRPGATSVPENLRLSLPGGSQAAGECKSFGRQSSGRCRAVFLCRAE